VVVGAATAASSEVSFNPKAGELQRCMKDEVMPEAWGHADLAVLTNPSCRQSYLPSAASELVPPNSMNPASAARRRRPGGSGMPTRGQGWLELITGQVNQLSAAAMRSCGK
jgi:hypothetical protein